ncbi:MAG: efflux RND transporter periplasmic adaptor subunit, partial [Gemmatimonadetes bacterium]|nr:efflux RND transporter periplasmic adaptor subunit [Gemmatimonadota bacterium]
MYRPIVLLAVTALAASGCAKKAAPPVYQALAVEHRDIIVSAQASGSIKPDTLIEVRSQASGEVTQIKVQTGDLVKRGALMVEIDPRTARNNVEQAQAAFDVAKATVQNATAAKRRSDELFQSQSISETERDAANLTFANANADLVRTRVTLENARIALEQTEVRSPIEGTVITKTIERGSVITSSTSGVGGGTVLLTMADLNLVQVRTLVDETDIGKVQPGQRVTVTVDAYPNRPFEGTVAKIEPQAESSQNATMFPVIVRVGNREGLLRPGMNAEVEIHVGERRDVLAVSNSALRTQRDVASADAVLGLDPADEQRQLAAADSAARASAPAGGDTRPLGGGRRPLPAVPCRQPADGPGAASRGPGRSRHPVRRAVHRLREAGEHPGARLDQDRAHRPRLLRGRQRPRPRRLGPRAAEREPDQRAVGDAEPDQPDDRRRQRPRDDQGPRGHAFRGRGTARREALMPLGEIIAVAFQSVRANKLRSLLTMLGIVIGVAAVITMVALGSGAQKAVEDRINALGANLLSVFPGQMFSGGRASDVRVSMTVDDANALSRDARLLAAVVPEMQQNVTVKYGTANLNLAVVGSTPNYTAVKNYTIPYGRMFTVGDDEARQRYVLVGASVPQMLNVNPAALIHQTIWVKGIPFEVIGVLSEKGAAGSWQN